MSGYRIYNSQLPHFVTFTIVDWIDVFTRQVFRDIIIESLEYCRQKKGMQIFAWVLMPNHLHLIIRAKGEKSLSEIIRDFKKFTSKRIVKELVTNKIESRRSWMLWMFKRSAEFRSTNKEYQVWQHGFHPVEITSDHFWEQRLNYIHYNPVKAGLCYMPEHYPYSSAKWYLDGEGILRMDDIKSYEY